MQKKKENRFLYLDLSLSLFAGRRIKGGERRRRKIVIIVKDVEFRASDRAAEGGAMR